jgi:hypothetical protein
MEALTDLPGDFNHSALERCREVLGQVAQRPDRVRITVTSSFAEVVQRVDPNAHKEFPYQQERPLGTAMARTIGQADGSFDIVVDARLFLPPSPPDLPVHMFEHETRHVAMEERGEGLVVSLTDWWPSSGRHPIELVGMAAVAIEEARIERLVCSQRPPILGGHLSAIDQQAKRFYREAKAACMSYQGHLDVLRLHWQVLEPFHALFTSSAYVAGEIAVAGQTAADIDMPEIVDEYVLGGPWRAVVDALRAVPDADTPTERDSLEKRAIQVAELSQAWLEHIGFTYDQDKNRDVRFLIHHPARWDASIPGL